MLVGVRHSSRLHQHVARAGGPQPRILLVQARHLCVLRLLLAGLAAHARLKLPQRDAKANQIRNVFTERQILARLLRALVERLVPRHHFFAEVGEPGARRLGHVGNARRALVVDRVRDLVANNKAHALPEKRRQRHGLGDDDRVRGDIVARVCRRRVHHPLKVLRLRVHQRQRLPRVAAPDLLHGTDDAPARVQVVFYWAQRVWEPHGDVDAGNVLRELGARVLVQAAPVVDVQHLVLRRGLHVLHGLARGLAAGAIVWAVVQQHVRDIVLHVGLHPHDRVVPARPGHVLPAQTRQVELAAELPQAAVRAQQRKVREAEPGQVGGQAGAVQRELLADGLHGVAPEDGGLQKVAAVIHRPRPRQHKVPHARALVLHLPLRAEAVPLLAGQLGHARERGFYRVDVPLHLREFFARRVGVQLRQHV